MFFIWDQLVTWVLLMLTSTFKIVSVKFFEFFNMNLSTFETFIPIKTLFNVFQGIGISIAAILAMTTIAANLFVIVTDSHEDSLKVLGRSIIACTAIVFATEIFNWIHWIFSQPFNIVSGEFNKMSNNLSEAYAKDTIDWEKLANRITGDDNSIAMKIVCIVLFIILAKNFFKLLISAAERYVVICVGSVTSPLAYSTLATKRTSSIALSFIKLLVCQYILMMFNVLFVRGSIYALSLYTLALYKNPGITTGGDEITPMVFLILIVAFLSMGQKMDQYLRTLGLDVHTMGPALGNELLSTGLGAMFAVGSVARGIARGGTRRFAGKGGGSSKGSSGFGEMVTGGAIKPKPGGGGGIAAALDKLTNGKFSQSLANRHFKDGKYAPTHAADVFSSLAGNLNAQEGYVRGAAGAVLKSSANPMLNNVGQALQDGNASLMRGKNGAFTIQDNAGRLATMLPANFNPQEARALGASPIMSDDGKILGYVGNADIGFGTPELKAGESTSIGNIMSQDDIASLGLSGSETATFDGENGYSIASNDNYLGHLQYGNDESGFNAQDYSLATENELGSIGFDKAVDQDTLGEFKLAASDIEDGFVQFDGKYYDTAELANALAHDNNTNFGEGDIIADFVDNGDGSYTYTNEAGISGTQDQLNIAAYGLNGYDSLPDNAQTYSGMCGSLFESDTSSKEFVDATGLYPTTATGYDNGVLRVEGVDINTGRNRSVEISDVSVSGNKDHVFETRFGRMGL